MQKSQKLYAAIASIVLAVVFYTIAGLIVAVAPNEIESSDSQGGLTVAGKKLEESYPDEINKI